jgi:uncharacterized OB-fold protein
MSDKPLPELDGFAKEFYAWCRRGDLRFQRCSNCQTWRHVPREMCARCGSDEWKWVKSGGKGTVFTWTVAERAMHPAFVDAVPYAPVVVELDEGVRLVTEIVDCAPNELQIGMAVEVAFEKVSDDLTLPKFRRATT